MLMKFDTHECRIISFTGEDEYKHPSFAAPTKAFCSYGDSTGKIARDSDGNDVIINATLRFSIRYTITVRDRIKLDGVTYKIVSVNKIYAGSGQVHHNKVLVARIGDQ